MTKAQEFDGGVSDDSFVRTDHQAYHGVGKGQPS